MTNAYVGMRPEEREVLIAVAEMLLTLTGPSGAFSMSLQSQASTKLKTAVQRLKDSIDD